jgi:hypothetical protein
VGWVKTNTKKALRRSLRQTKEEFLQRTQDKTKKEIEEKFINYRALSKTHNMFGFALLNLPIL